MLSIYVLACLFFNVATLLEYTIILLYIRLKNDEKAGGKTKEKRIKLNAFKDRVDFGTMIAYYIGFGMFNLIYVMYALKK